ncbi:MAG: hypothetical protein EZS28_010504 [Streblomastix strix]|uniref:Uncharacterized protein n=1 Tax=Streblomastix strix TaxID=222440 RepID=A0A5J4WGD9_9EUKA|nr:MAG: hypothetical protein EZS28_010504 [Streblomastix strix]
MKQFQVYDQQHKQIKDESLEIKRLNGQGVYDEYLEEGDIIDDVYKEDQEGVLNKEEEQDEKDDNLEDEFQDEFGDDYEFGLVVKVVIVDYFKELQIKIMENKLFTIMSQNYSKNVNVMEEEDVQMVRNQEKEFIWVVGQN